MLRGIIISCATFGCCWCKYLLSAQLLVAQASLTHRQFNKDVLVRSWGPNERQLSDVQVGLIIGGGRSQLWHIILPLGDTPNKSVVPCEMVRARWRGLVLSAVLVTVLWCSQSYVEDVLNKISVLLQSQMLGAATVLYMESSLGWFVLHKSCLGYSCFASIDDLMWVSLLQELQPGPRKLLNLWCSYIITQ